MLDVERILAKLAELRSRDPGCKLLGAGSHRYVLNPTLSVSDLAAFERAHAIVLPDDYRTFLHRLGNGGAGPGHGVFPLGEKDDGPTCSAWCERDGFVGDLSDPFPHDSDYFDVGPVDGAVPICHHGDAVRSWLIVSGAERGNVWYDARAEGGQLQPHQSKDGRHVTFGAWYEGWLDTWRLT